MIRTEILRQRIARVSEAASFKISFSNVRSDKALRSQVFSVSSSFSRSTNQLGEICH